MRLFLLILSLTLFIGAMFPKTDAPQMPPPAWATPGFSDVLLYQHISKRVKKGASYHEAAAMEQRSHGYELKPFVTVRPPMFAWLTASLPLQSFRTWLFAISIFAFAMLPGLALAERVGVAVLTMFAGWHALVGEQWFHDWWAGMLLAISFAIYRQRTWWPSIAVAFLAALLRELSLPFLCLGAAFALVERRWTELAGWAVSLFGIAIYFFWHYLAVTAELLPDDRISNGWGAMLGIPTAIHMVSQLSVFRLFPEWLAHVLVALSVIGWLGLRNRYGVFAFLYCTGMIALFAMGARFNNFYWAFLVFPIWAPGLALAPRLLYVEGMALWRRWQTLKVATA